MSNDSIPRSIRIRSDGTRESKVFFLIHLLLLLLLFLIIIFFLTIQVSSIKPAPFSPGTDSTDLLHPRSYSTYSSTQTVGPIQYRYMYLKVDDGSTRPTALSPGPRGTAGGESLVPLKGGLRRGHFQPKYAKQLYVD